MTKQNWVRSASVLAVVLTVFAFSRASEADNGSWRYRSFGSSHQARSVVGSWDATIDFFGATGRAMYSFHSDGTLTEADNPGFDPGFNGDALSPGIGAWKRSVRRGGVARYQKFAYNTEGQLTLVYVSTVAMTLESDGTMSGTISIEVSTPDGTVVNEIPELPFTATRIGADL